jgi:hypothetical protein
MVYHRYLQFFALELLLRCLHFRCYRGACSSQLQVKRAGAVLRGYRFGLILKQPRRRDPLTHSLSPYAVNRSSEFPPAPDNTRQAM